MEAIIESIPETDAVLVPKFGVSLTDIKARCAEYATLDATEDYKGVVRAISDFRTTRVAIDKRRKELNADALDYQRRINRVAGELTSLISPTEQLLKAKKRAVDDEKARLKAEKEAQRQAIEYVTAQLAEAIAVGGRDWQRRIDAAAEAERRAAREAEETRLAAERKQLELERARHEAEKRKADELARIEREKEEARQAAEREKLEAERRAIAEEQRKLEEAKRAVELEEAKRQARIQAEKEAAERAERERVEADERRLAELDRQKREAERLEALKPDMEKLADYAAAVRAVPMPDLSDMESGKVLAVVAERIYEALGVIVEFCGDE